MAETRYEQRETAEQRCDELARQALTGEWLDSFLKLDLDAKLTGIAFMANISDDERMCIAALQLRGSLA